MARDMLTTGHRLDIFRSSQRSAVLGFFTVWTNSRLSVRLMSRLGGSSFVIREFWPSSDPEETPCYRNEPKVFRGAPQLAHNLLERIN